jgi:CRISPR-associated endonuclease Cas2
MYIVVYDIGDNRQLQRVARLLEKKGGVRAQNSLFEFQEYKLAKEGMEESLKLLSPEDRCFLFRVTGKEDLHGSSSPERIY